MAQNYNININNMNIIEHFYNIVVNVPNNYTNYMPCTILFQRFAPWALDEDISGSIPDRTK